MARFVACACVAGLFTNVLGAMRFINPPTMLKLGDLSNAQSYKEGSSVNVAWTQGKAGVGCSLVLYQQHESNGEWYGAMEYLTQNAVDMTNYNWLVATRKNLTESNLFYLSIFQEGTGPSDDNSEYFYIEPKEAVVASPSPTPTPSASSSLSSARSSASPTSSGSSGTSASAASSSTTPTSNPSPSTSASTNSSSSSSGFPTAAKIGVGVGIPVALIIGLAAGFLLFRRRKKNNMAHEPVPGAAPGYYGGGHGAPQEYRYQDNTYPVAPGELDGGHGRVEMSQDSYGAGKQAHQAPVRYEM
ncbi:hypothetical protein NX059_002268 [Plenodomus lindquistii]|nr:hypothetical protein NX059_002268 [Plenodomus lindquistii]